MTSLTHATSTQSNSLTVYSTVFTLCYPHNTQPKKKLCERLIQRRPRHGPRGINLWQYFSANWVHIQIQQPMQILSDQNSIYHWGHTGSGQCPCSGSDCSGCYCCYCRCCCYYCCCCSRCWWCSPRPKGAPSRKKETPIESSCPSSTVFCHRSTWLPSSFMSIKRHGN